MLFGKFVVLQVPDFLLEGLVFPAQFLVLPQEELPLLVELLGQLVSLPAKDPLLVLLGVVELLPEAVVGLFFIVVGLSQLFLGVPFSGDFPQEVAVDLQKLLDLADHCLVLLVTLDEQFIHLYISSFLIYAIYSLYITQT